MLTAERDVVKEDGVTPADPFDMGAGEVNVVNAMASPLVMDETYDNYLASNPAEGGDIKTLNTPSLANDQCLNVCTWTRTFESSAAASVTWNVSGTMDDGSLSASPASFTLAPGETQQVTFTVDVTGSPTDAWIFGSAELTNTDGVQDLHLPVAVIPSTGIFDTHVDIGARRDAGSWPLDVEAVSIDDLQLSHAGFALGTPHAMSLSTDATEDQVYDNIGDGTVEYVEVEVPAGADRLVAEITASEATDVDLYMGRDLDGDGPEVEEQLCVSASGTALEYCNVDAPDAGTWWVLVQNWEGSGASEPDAIDLMTAVVTGPQDNMDVQGPSGSIPELTPFEVRVFWDQEMAVGDRLYGSFRMGSAAGSVEDIGRVTVDLERIEDDVTKSVAATEALRGDTVTYTLTVQPNVSPEDAQYTITDQLPPGLTYVDGSVAVSGTDQTIEPVVGDDGTLTFTVDMPANARGFYEMSTPATDPACDTGFGGYLDLDTGAGIQTDPSLTGDTKFWAFGNGAPYDFYGTDVDAFGVTDDGFVGFSDVSWAAGEPWTPQALPDPADPNGIAAPLWFDGEVQYDAGTNQGITVASIPGAVSIIEYDGLEPFSDGGTPDPIGDMEVVIYNDVDPDFPEIIFAYDNLDMAALPAEATIGTENRDGTLATTLLNLADPATVLADGLQVCFDYTLPIVNISYDVVVGPDADSGIVKHRDPRAGRAGRRGRHDHRRPRAARADRGLHLDAGTTVARPGRGLRRQLVHRRHLGRGHPGPDLRMGPGRRRLLRRRHGGRRGDELPHDGRLRRGPEGHRRRRVHRHGAPDRSGRGEPAAGRLRRTRPDGLRR